MNENLNLLLVVRLDCLGPPVRRLGLGVRAASGSDGSDVNRWTTMRRLVLEQHEYWLEPTQIHWCAACQARPRILVNSPKLFIRKFEYQPECPSPAHPCKRLFRFRAGQCS